MTYALLERGCENSKLNELLSKEIFDRVESQAKKMPEFDDSGRKKLDSVGESGIVNFDNSTIPVSPNLYKEYGVLVENSGYFIIPRSLMNDPRYQGARMKYKIVLLTILKNAAFAQTTHAIGCEVISIGIGQFCTSIRGLTDLCNEGVKYKEDLIDKNIVERASHFWCRCGFVRQEVRHGKTILTVTIPEFYAKEKNECETGIETKPRQNRDTKEEYKEDKEDNISSKKEGTFVPSELATSLLAEFYSSLFLAIPNFPKDNARKTKSQYQAADRIFKKANGDMELIRKVISYAHQQGGFWISHVHSVSYLDKKFVTLVQQLRDQGKKPMNGQKPSKHNNPNFAPKDLKPLAFNNKLSFKE